MFDFLEAIITQQTSPEEAFAKFDTLCVRYGEGVRRAANHLKDARRHNNTAAINAAV